MVLADLNPRLLHPAAERSSILSAAPLASTESARETARETKAVAPYVFTPDELRQLHQQYRDLLELHRAEVVEDENLDDAHRLLVEQVLPLRAILREQARRIVESPFGVTY
jgi:hypothetical protein